MQVVTLPTSVTMMSDIMAISRDPKAATCLGVGYRPLPPSCPAGPKIPPGCFWVVQKALKKYPPSAMDGCGDGGECGGQLGTKRGGKGDFLFSAHPVPQHLPQHCGVASIFSN